MHCLRSVLLFLFILLGLTPVSWACAICAPSETGGTLRQRLRAADVVVLAAPTAGNTFVTRLMIKGGAPQGQIRLPQGVSELAQVSSLVLLYRNGTADWQSAGPLAPHHADWARRLVALTDATDLTPARWTSLIASFLPELESLEPLVAQAAYEEIASAPYAALRATAPRLNAAQLLRWLDTPALTARRPLYALLLGFTGHQASAEGLQQRMAGLRGADDAPTLSAMIAAWLELRGPEGVAWVERQYLSAPTAHEMGVSAALLALRVHGGDGQRIGRSRVV